jgi:hypothetical protein
MFYSESTGGFYDPVIHGDNIPADAVEITSEEHATLLSAQSAGKIIQADSNGTPIAVDPPTPSLTKLKSGAIKQIDADVDEIYKAVIGNRDSEYALAEAEAKAFAAAGYLASDVPASVQSWADAKQKTPTWAADDIIATAAAWRAVQASLRTNRLSTKEAVRSATDQAGIDTALAAWELYVAAIRAALGI